MILDGVVLFYLHTKEAAKLLLIAFFVTQN